MELQYYKEKLENIKKIYNNGNGYVLEAKILAVCLVAALSKKYMKFNEKGSNDIKTFIKTSKDQLYFTKTLEECSHYPWKKVHTAKLHKQINNPIYKDKMPQKILKKIQKYAEELFSRIDYTNLSDSIKYDIDYDVIRDKINKIGVRGGISNDSKEKIFTAIFNLKRSSILYKDYRCNLTHEYRDSHESLEQWISDDRNPTDWPTSGKKYPQFSINTKHIITSIEQIIGVLEKAE